MIIAMHPDNQEFDDPELRNTSWIRWKQSAEQAGHQVRIVDALAPDILQQLHECDAFMWRYLHRAPEREAARRLLPVLERQLGLAVYPDQNTAWHFDDKIAQAYLLPAANIPIPRTWVFWRIDDALKFAQSAQYPIVMKFTGGAGSENVKLIRTASELEELTRRAFDMGLVSLHDKSAGNWPVLKHRLKNSVNYMMHGNMSDPASRADVHKNYVLLQEFLDGNEFDTRITVIGNRAFGFRRFNRPDDFRASGSGRIDYNTDEVDPLTVRLAFHVARVLHLQSVAIDGLRRGEERVVGEISYAYVSSAIYNCRGHWRVNGDPSKGELEWVDGQMWPEEAQMQDFLEVLRHRQK